MTILSNHNSQLLLARKALLETGATDRAKDILSHHFHFSKEGLVSLKRKRTCCEEARLLSTWAHTFDFIREMVVDMIISDQKAYCYKAIINVLLSNSSTSGVVQYDFGKETKDGFQRIGMLLAPPNVLLNALAKLKARHEVYDSRLPEFITAALERSSKFAQKYSHPEGSIQIL